MFAALNWKSITSSSGLPFNSRISSPGTSPTRSAREPCSTDRTRSFCVSESRCAAASRYSCTALRTYAEEENCFLVLLIQMPLTQAANEVVTAGECRHQSRRIEKDVQ